MDLSKTRYKSVIAGCNRFTPDQKGRLFCNGSMLVNLIPAANQPASAQPSVPAQPNPVQQPINPVVQQPTNPVVAAQPTPVQQPANPVVQQPIAPNTSDSQGQKDEIEIVASAHLWRGEPILVVKSQGKTIHQEPITARDAQKATQTVKLAADLKGKPFEIGFYNDGSKKPGGDRNLFIHEVRVNGIRMDLSKTRYKSVIAGCNRFTPDQKGRLFCNGSMLVNLIPAANQTPVTTQPAQQSTPSSTPEDSSASIEQGTNQGQNDRIEIVASADLLNGGPKLVIRSNGETIHQKVITANAAEKATQTVKLDADLKGQPLEILFYNDASNGQGGDRNLIIHEVKVNGVTLDLSQAQYKSPKAKCNLNRFTSAKTVKMFCNGSMIVNLPQS